MLSTRCQRVALLLRRADSNLLPLFQKRGGNDPEENGHSSHSEDDMHDTGKGKRRLGMDIGEQPLPFAVHIGRRHTAAVEGTAEQALLMTAQQRFFYGAMVVVCHRYKYCYNNKRWTMCGVFLAFIKSLNAAILRYRLFFTPATLMFFLCAMSAKGICCR